MRLRYALLVLILGASTLAWGQARPGSLRGTVKDKTSGEELPQAQISVKSGNFKIAVGQSDFDGNYNINPIQPGTYTVVCEVFGYNSVTFTGVQINPGRPTELKFALASSSVELGAIDVVAKYEAPLIEKGKTAATYGAEQIRNLAGRGVNAVLSQTASVVQDERSGGTFFRGGRGDANVV
ncbi:MAG: carboxypeptidase-like regulatory domain-containing protein, partial [Schleiferiaceae bacterium]